MFRVKFNRKYPLNPFIETDWNWFIELAWGKRRLSSRVSAEFRAKWENPRRPGYLRHGRIGAALGLWIKWFWQSFRRKISGTTIEYVIIEDDREGHGPRYAAELLERAIEQERARVRAAMTPERLADLQRQRDEARARKDFATADALRDQILAAGLVVADAKIGSDQFRAEKNGLGMTMTRAAIAQEKQG